MNTAWNEARKAASIFGGKASEFFASCLRSAWVTVKAAAIKARITAKFAAIDKKAAAKKAVATAYKAEAKSELSLLEIIERDIKPRKRKSYHFKRVNNAHNNWHMHKFCASR